jgi:hypothetical protein
MGVPGESGRRAGHKFCSLGNGFIRYLCTLKNSFRKVNHHLLSGGLNLIMDSAAGQDRFFGLVYNSPQRPQIDAAVEVSVHFEAAVPASRNLTPPLTGMVAVRKSLRSVGRVYTGDLHTGKRPLILDKLPQLAEGPAAQLLSEPFVPLPLRGEADMGQLPGGYPFSLGLGAGDNGLADGVVDDGSSRSFSRKPFQQFPAIPGGGTRSTCLCAFATGHVTHTGEWINKYRAKRAGIRSSVQQDRKQKCNLSAPKKIF